MDPGNDLEWVKSSEMCSEQQLLDDPECRYDGAVTGQTMQQLNENQRKKAILAREHARDMTPHLFDLEGELSPAAGHVTGIQVLSNNGVSISRQSRLA